MIDPCFARFFPVQPHADAFGHQHRLGHGAHAVRRFDPGILFGGQRGLGGISGLLVPQTAHEPAATARDLGSIDGQSLLLGHFDRNLSEIRQIGGAAKGPAAHAKTADEARLVADTDLPQFDAGVEHGGQVPHQFPEIHPPLGSEIKEQFGMVKGILRVHQTHIQLVQCDLFPADPQRLLLQPAVFGICLFVFRGGNPQNRTERLSNLAGRQPPARQNHLAVFRAAGGIHQHALSHPERKLAGLEEIDLARVTEAHAHHGHGFFARRGQTGGHIFHQITRRGDVHGKTLLGFLFFAAGDAAGAGVLPGGQKTVELGVQFFFQPLRQPESAVSPTRVLSPAAGAVALSVAGRRLRAVALRRVFGLQTGILPLRARSGQSHGRIAGISGGRFPGAGTGVCPLLMGGLCRAGGAIPRTGARSARIFGTAVPLRTGGILRRIFALRLAVCLHTGRVLRRRILQSAVLRAAAAPGTPVTVPVSARILGARFSGAGGRREISGTDRDLLPAFVQSVLVFLFVSLFFH